MGNKVPIADERMQKTIDMLRLKKQDVRKMWKCFRKHDKDKSGSMARHDSADALFSDALLHGAGFSCPRIIALRFDDRTSTNFTA